MQHCMTLKYCELNTSYLLIYDRYVAILLLYFRSCARAKERPFKVEK